MKKETIGSRLRSEREKLNLSQTTFAKMAGASRRAQISYETDEQIPGGKYLSEIANLGVDVPYVLVGSVPLSIRITPSEAFIISNYRIAEPEVKLAIDILLKIPEEHRSKK